MVNFRIISKIIGSLLFIEAFFMAWCVAIAFYYHEDDTLAFLLSMLLTFGSAFLFLLAGRKAENSLSRHDAFVVVNIPIAGVAASVAHLFVGKGHMHHVVAFFLELDRP